VTNRKYLIKLLFCTYVSFPFLYDDRWMVGGMRVVHWDYACPHWGTRDSGAPKPDPAEAQIYRKHCPVPSLSDSLSPNFVIPYWLMKPGNIYKH